MRSDEDNLEIYECQSCGNVGISPEEMTCCDEPMEAVRDDTAIEPPELEHVVRSVFGISSTELEVCRCIMQEGEAITAEVAERLDIDRSLVLRHLNHLTELNVLEKRSRLLAEGGRINVYSPGSQEMIRRQFKLGLYTWLTEAAEVIDEMSQEKMKAMARSQAESNDDRLIYWNS